MSSFKVCVVDVLNVKLIKEFAMSKEPGQRHVTHLGRNGKPDHTVHSVGDKRFSYDTFKGKDYHRGHYSDNVGYRDNNPQDVEFGNAPWNMFPPPG